MTQGELCSLCFSIEEIHKKRQEVRRSLISRSRTITGGRIDRLATSDLRIMFEIYDTCFFGGYFASHFRGEISFSLSARMSRNAAKLMSPRNLASLRPEQERYEIRVGTVFFFSYYRTNRDKPVNGIPTRDALHALQLVFEHELCHLLELHCYKTTSCRRARFKAIARQVFGHTDSYHHLPTYAEIAEARSGLGVGDRVSFHHDGREMYGVISRITRRATVMVPDLHGDYVDRHGEKHTKWYVPLKDLERSHR